MSAKLMIVWDYDTALGQINSTMPYNFSYKQIYEEIENVDYILEEAARLNMKMTFACVGFVAEEGVFPFNNPEQIRKYILLAMRLLLTPGSMNGFRTLMKSKLRSHWKEVSLHWRNV